MQAVHRFYVGDKLTLVKALDGIPVGEIAEVDAIDFTDVKLLFKMGIWGTYSAALVQTHFELPHAFHQRTPHAITGTRRPDPIRRTR